MSLEALDSSAKKTARENSPPIVFISYSQGCANKDTVLRLAASLQKDGCDVRIDVEKKSDEDWIQWMERQLNDANFVLCMVSKSYAERFRPDVNLDEGYGVAWEAGLIARKLYSSKWQNGRFLPCFFSRADRKYIPDMLTGYDEYLLDSEAGYEKLLRRIFETPEKKLPDIGERPPLKTSTVEPLFPRGESTPIDDSGKQDETSDNVEMVDTTIDSTKLNALLSRINRDEQKDSLVNYLLSDAIVEKRDNVGAVCVITGAKADDCLNLFALTCLECFADSIKPTRDDELLQMLRSSVVQSMLPTSLVGDSHRVGMKFETEIACVDPRQWAVFHCHIDKASRAVKVAEHFLEWRSKNYNADGRKVLLVLFTDKIGQGRVMPSMACVVSSPALIEKEHLTKWRTYIEGQSFLSKGQIQVLSNALSQLKDRSVRLLAIQDMLRDALDSA